MIEYMRKMETLREAPGAEALDHPQKQLNLANFFYPLKQSKSQVTTPSFQTPGKTIQGVVLAKTASANLHFMGNGKKAMGGANLEAVWSCQRAENNPLGEGEGVNWGSPQGQKMKRESGGQGQTEADKNCEDQKQAISVTIESAVLKSVLKPDEEGDKKTSRSLQKVSP